MKLPDEITVFSVTYPIIYVDNAIDVDINKDSTDLTAQVAFTTPSIRILRKYKGKERTVDIIWRDIIHEAIHIILVLQGISAGLTDEAEEELVMQLTCGLSDFLWRNIFTPMKGNKMKETKNVN